MTPTTTKRKLPRQQETTTNNIKWLCTTTPTVQVIKQEKPKCVSVIALCKRTVIITEGGKFSPTVQQNTGLQGAFLSHVHKILVYRGHFSPTCTKYGWQGAVLSHMHKIWFTGGISLLLCTEHWFTGGTSLQLCTEHWFTRGGKSSPTVCRTPTYSEKFSPIVKTFPPKLLCLHQVLFGSFSPVCLHRVPFSLSVCTKFPFPVCLHQVPFSLSVCTKFPFPVCLHQVPFPQSL